MKLVTSVQNPQYKEMKALATNAKTRRHQNQTLLEGIHLATSWFDAGHVPQSGVISESALGNQEVTALVRRAQQAGVPLSQVSDQLFRALSNVENGVGVVLVIEMPQQLVPDVLTDSAVLLDNVQDPGNVGTILRTAAAAGIRQVYCSPGTASVWAPKVLRAAMGAHVALQIYENVGLADLIADASIPVFATTLEAKQTLYDTDLSEPAAWLLGNEGQGVSPQLLTSRVTQVIIPQTHGVESLNVAAATAVCLFEQRRQVLAAR